MPNSKVETVEAKLRDILSSNGFDTDDITHSSELQNDLGMDSLDCVEVIIDIEDKFDIQMSDELDFRTFGELLAQVNKLVKQ